MSCVTFPLGQVVRKVSRDQPAHVSPPGIHWFDSIFFIYWVGISSISFVRLCIFARCVLYSSVAGKPIVESEQQGHVWSGTARDEESMTYLGPSMDIDKRC